MHAEIRQLPVIAKGLLGLTGSTLSAMLARSDWEPALKLTGIVLGLLVTLATLVNITYGIVIRHKKLRLLDQGKDVSA